MFYIQKKSLFDSQSKINRKITKNTVVKPAAIGRKSQESPELNGKLKLIENKVIVSYQKHYQAITGIIKITIFRMPFKIMAIFIFPISTLFDTCYGAITLCYT